LNDNKYVKPYFIFKGGFQGDSVGHILNPPYSPFNIEVLFSIHTLQLKGDELLCHFPAFLGVAK
jgi:hypothetical protein